MFYMIYYSYPSDCFRFLQKIKKDNIFQVVFHNCRHVVELAALVHYIAVKRPVVCFTAPQAGLEPATL